MKKVLVTLFSFVAINVFAQGVTPATTVGPVTVGVCPTATTCPKQDETKKVKPKDKPKTNKTVCPVKECPKCEAKIKEKIVKELSPFKKNTLSLFLGRGPNGITYDLHKENIQLQKGYGLITGIRYERRLDESWSVSGEFLTSESGNLGVGFSW